MIKDIVGAISDFIFVENKPEKADAIMILGGSHPELGERAAQLWKSGYAPVVFASGGFSVKLGKFPGPKSKTDIYDRAYETEFDFFTDVLIKNGVSLAAIHGENKSTFTKENALFAREAAEAAGFSIQRAILVCKAFHARRSLMYYQMAFPDAAFLVCPVPAHGITKENWFRSDYGIERVMGELSRCGNQFTEDFISNKALLADSCSD